MRVARTVARMCQQQCAGMDNFVQKNPFFVAFIAGFQILINPDFKVLYLKIRVLVVGGPTWETPLLLYPKNQSFI